MPTRQSILFRRQMDTRPYCCLRSISRLLYCDIITHCDVNFGRLYSRCFYLLACKIYCHFPITIISHKWLRFPRTHCWRTHHDDVIKWKHFPCYWSFVRGIHRSPVNSKYKGQWRGALMFSLICAWINGWVNNREAGDLRHHRAHCDVIVMYQKSWEKFTLLYFSLVMIE